MPCSSQRLIVPESPKLVLAGTEPPPKLLARAQLFAPVEVRELRPDPHFESVEDVRFHPSPWVWVAYGLGSSFEVSQLARIAELTGRLPRRGGQTAAGFKSRAREKDVLNVTHILGILWDGEQRRDGLFAPHEVEIVEREPGKREMRVGKLDEPLDEKRIEHVELLLAADIRRALRWLIGTSWRTFDPQGTELALDSDEISQAVDAATCGTRSFDLRLPGNVTYRYTSTWNDELLWAINAARMLARSGNAGDTARKLDELSDELDAVRSIWVAYCGKDPLGCGAYEARKVAEANGIDAFVRSYLEDGVPLEDILA